MKTRTSAQPSGTQTVIGQEFDLAGADRVLTYGSWAARYHGTPGAPPKDLDVLVKQFQWVVGGQANGDHHTRRGEHHDHRR